MDWGNKEVIDESNLYQLPLNLSYIEKQSLKVKLFMITPIHTND